MDFCAYAWVSWVSLDLDYSLLLTTKTDRPASRWSLRGNEIDGTNGMVFKKCAGLSKAQGGKPGVLLLQFVFSFFSFCC